MFLACSRFMFIDLVFTRDEEQCAFSHLLAPLANVPCSVYLYILVYVYLPFSLPSPLITTQGVSHIIQRSSVFPPKSNEAGVSPCRMKGDPLVL